MIIFIPTLSEHWIVVAMDRRERVRLNMNSIDDLQRPLPAMRSAPPAEHWNRVFEPVVFLDCSSVTTRLVAISILFCLWFFRLRQGFALSVTKYCLGVFWQECLNREYPKSSKLDLLTTSSDLQGHSCSTPASLFSYLEVIMIAIKSQSWLSRELLLVEMLSDLDCNP